MPTTDEQYGAVLTAVARHTHTDYVIAIPSYRRADRLPSRTLTTLERLGLNERERVTVFVDEDEADVYRAALDDGWQVAVAPRGLVPTRRFYCHDYYPPGTPIINMDDDIDEVLARTDGGKTIPWQGTLDQLAAMGFGMCDGLGVGLWGICGYNNGLYMHDEAVAGLRYILGAVFGTFGGHTNGLESDDIPESGEDFERSLHYFTHDGAVVRLDWLSQRTTNFAAGGIRARLGGYAERDRDHASKLRAIALRYPKLVGKVYRKADGTTNLRLKDITTLRVPRAALESAAHEHR